MPNIKHEVLIAAPKNFDDAASIVNSVKAGKSVFVKMEEVEIKMAQRLVDFLSGASTAIGGELKEMGGKIFLFVSKNVEISEYFNEELKNNNIFSEFKRTYGK
jgi:cell division inhibitor SepF